MHELSIATLSREDSAPLFAQMRDVLRTSIIKGVLQPGARLPSESELIERFKISRITVRQAIAELQALGLVVTVNGKGTFVAKSSAPSEHGPLAGLIQQMKQQGHQVDGRLIAAKDIAAPAEVSAELGIARGRRVTAIEIIRNVDGRPIAIGTLFVEPTLGKRMMAAGVGERDVTAVLETDLGIRVGKSNVSVTAICADAKLAKALKYQAGQPVLVVCMTIIDIENAPILRSVVHFRGDLMDYKVTVKR